MTDEDYDAVWCVVMFDLPVKTKAERREASRFRNKLLDDGFSRAQLSVYVQYLPLAARLSSVVKSIKSELPRGGEIRILTVSDIQWSKAIRFFKSEPLENEEVPSQLSFF